LGRFYKNNAKQIETAAFITLALLKQNAAPILVKDGIEFILKQRKHGRFGSTQSTAMALKALIEYTKTQKNHLIGDNNITLKINGKSLKMNLIDAKDGKIKLKHIAKYLKEDRQDVTITYSDKKLDFPYVLDIKWDSYVPNSSAQCRVDIKTEITSPENTVGNTLRMDVKITNLKDDAVPMTTAIIGIPSGASFQPWQLKELIETKKVAYYEIFDNYLVLYWKYLTPNEEKVIALDLKAEVAGTYKAPASTVYVYYEDEYKKWIAGTEVKIIM